MAPLDTANTAPADPIPPAVRGLPHIRLRGDVNDLMFQNFLDGVAAAGAADPMVVELTTCGGDAETGRRIALEVRLLREQGRRMCFLGKTVVYSAGVTIMGGFARADRFLSSDTVLLVHGRRMEKTVQLSGPLKSMLQTARELVSDIELGLELERRSFEALVEGSDVTLEEAGRRAQDNWYVTAEEALQRRLVAGLI